MKANKLKPASPITKAWWITLGTILFTGMFLMGQAPVETEETDEVSNMDKLVYKTGVKNFADGFVEMGLDEEGRNAYKAEKTQALIEGLKTRKIENEERVEDIVERYEKNAEIDMEIARLQQTLDKIEAGEYKAKGLLPTGIGQIVMILIGLLLIYLAIAKGFEPLLLLPIGFGGILANIPAIEMASNAHGVLELGSSAVIQAEGFLHVIYSMGIENGLFPLFIFMGVGAMTDFGPLIANPKTALLGAAAQAGIFATLLGALWLSGMTDAINYSIQDAAAIGIIGGADGPTSIFVASRLSPRLLGAIAVAAYSYMALVPIIQPPIMNALTTKEQRKIKMEQLRPVGKLEKIVFPLTVLFLCILLLPDATPLIGMLMFGNLAKESGVVDRLSDTIQNAFINIVTILLGLSVGSKLSAEKFLSAETLGILVLGAIAFSIGTAAGVGLAHLMNLLSKKKINPLIGAAGVSAVPMAARVVNKVGLDNNPQNFMLMHAMGPNVSGVIGSAVAAGVLLALV